MVLGKGSNIQGSSKCYTKFKVDLYSDLYW